MNFGAKIYIFSITDKYFVLKNAKVGILQPTNAFYTL